ncbi:TM2 domain protein [Poriferisphaera corsica]|uniref:TM2 domain protein n=1 Tax=Poriferisphaera corsica TaxID=2528020 RepID=A0A517YU18_9BACT|nr:NINE protein [Poriferisphaera corsica]QDU33723.1 TM2 domain protein [Poriferisphaera corsica]
MQVNNLNKPSTPTAYLLWCLCFIGLCGIHRFYSGRWVTGIIWILTGGLLLIGQIIDLFLIPSQCENPKR